MKSNRRQTFYYHLGQACEDEFQVKVRLRSIASALSSKEYITSVHDIERTLRWQEKVENPIEYFGQTTSETTDPLTFIYTYTDKEFHCTYNTNRVKSSDSHLTDSVHSLPIHNLHSSDTLSKNAIRVHDRLSREDPLQTMYIVAAVDCHDMQSDYKDTKNLDRVKPYQFHEELLCTLKLYNSGLLEVNPGFSNIEPEDSDSDDIFVNNSDLETVAKEGPKLTTFTFSTPLGSIYQYSLEWIDYIIDEDVLEHLSLTVDDEQHEILSQTKKEFVLDRHQDIELVGSSLWPTFREELFIIDFETVTGFKPMWKYSSIRIDYEIVAPQGWKYELISGDQRSVNVGGSITGSSCSTKAFIPTKGDAKSFFSYPVAYFIFVLLATVFDANFIAIVAICVLFKVSNEMVFGFNLLPMHASVMPTYNLAHQVCLCRQRDTERNEPEICNTMEEIKIYFQICTFCDVGKRTIDGCGSLSIPINKSGINTFEVRTSKLKRSSTLWIASMFDLFDYYFGCSVGGLSTVRDLCNQLNRGSKLHNTIKSATSGVVRITCQIKKCKRSASIGYINMDKKDTLETILKVRQQQRTARQYAHGSSIGAINEDAMMNDKTRALLSRVKQMREDRKNRLSIDN